MISGGRRPLMGGNWKLNPQSVIKATALATEVNLYTFIFSFFNRDTFIKSIKYVWQIFNYINVTAK